VKAPFEVGLPLGLSILSEIQTPESQNGDHLYDHSQSVKPDIISDNQGQYPEANNDYIDLSPEANILYASDSIVDILGFHPGEVLGSLGVQMDKAASLHYARVINRDGIWVGCECVFTIVYEVLVACTSIYRGDAKNERMGTSTT